MLRRERTRLTPGRAVAVALLAVAATASIAMAQSSANFDLGWHKIAGGGNTVSTTNHILSFTVGQPDQGPIGQASWSSTNFRLTTGFWQPFQSQGSFDFSVYLPWLTKSP